MSGSEQNRVASIIDKPGLFNMSQFQSAEFFDFFLKICIASIFWSINTWRIEFDWCNFIGFLDHLRVVALIFNKRSEFKMLNIIKMEIITRYFGNYFSCLIFECVEKTEYVKRIN